jgi:hypothetical protein
MTISEELTHDEMFKVLPIEVMKVILKSLAPAERDKVIVLENELHKQLPTKNSAEYEEAVQKAYAKYEEAVRKAYQDEYEEAVRKAYRDETMATPNPTHDEMVKALPTKVLEAMMAPLEVMKATTQSQPKDSPKYKEALQMANANYEETVRNAYLVEYKENVRKTYANYDPTHEEMITALPIEVMEAMIPPPPANTMATHEELTHEEMFKVLPIEVMKVMLKSLPKPTLGIVIMLENELHKQLPTKNSAKYEKAVQKAYAEYEKAVKEAYATFVVPPTRAQTFEKVTPTTTSTLGNKITGVFSDFTTGLKRKLFRNYENN